MRASSTCVDPETDYWMRSNMPGGAEIASRPTTCEAYWVPVQAYFKEPAKRVSMKVHFKKHLHRFDALRTAALRDLACPDSGFFLAEARRDEDLYSNLIPVRAWPRFVEVGTTDHRLPGQVYAALRAAGHVGLSGEWLLGD